MQPKTKQGLGIIPNQIISTGEGMRTVQDETRARNNSEPHMLSGRRIRIVQVETRTRNSSEPNHFNGRTDT